MRPVGGLGSIRRGSGPGDVVVAAAVVVAVVGVAPDGIVLPVLDRDLYPASLVLVASSPRPDASACHAVDPEALCLDRATLVPVRGRETTGAESAASFEQYQEEYGRARAVAAVGHISEAVGVEVGFE